MANNMLVQTVNVPVFGKDDPYHISNIDKIQFGKWAIEVDQLLTAHTKLAKEKLILRDSITEAAKAALWNTIPALASIPQDYEDAAMPTATTAGAVNRRVNYHSQWLQQIAHACAPETPLQILASIRAVPFGTATKGEMYSSTDVLKYTAKLFSLQHRFGKIMIDLDDKRKLEAVKKSIPPTLKRILEDTVPTVPAGEGPYHDTWEKGLQRVAFEMNKVEQSKVVVKALQRTEKAFDARSIIRNKKNFKKRNWKGAEKTVRFKRQNPFQAKNNPHFENRKDFRNKDRRNLSFASKADGKLKFAPKSSGSKRKVDLSEVKCYRCGKMGHYANKCPKPK